MKTFESSEVRARASGRWVAILANLAPELNGALARIGRHVPCPHPGHPESTDGFRVFRDVDESGGGVCNSCGAFHDGFDLLRWLRGWSFPETLERVASVVELSPPMLQVRPIDPGRKERRGAVDDARIGACLKRVWSETVDPLCNRAAPLQRYLDGRGIDPGVLDTATCRYHPELAYWHEGERVGAFPAMLARVCDAEGRPVTIHRTYLSRSGAKAPVLAVKKIMPYAASGRLMGDAIRLHPASAGVLGVAEGIETALAVHCATGMPVWSAINTTLLEGFEIPEGVEMVVVWADKDRSGAGQRAARALQSRLWVAGVPAAIYLPRGTTHADAKSLDWNDVWCATGSTGFPKARRPILTSAA